MKLLIAIPSKGRADTIFNRTLRWVLLTGLDVRVFVEPQDLQAYQAAAGGRDGFQIISIEENDRGLSYAKGFIKRYAQDNGYGLVFKMDDDILRFSSRGPNLPDDEMVKRFCTMIDTAQATFAKYPDVAAIGFPYRNELYEPKEWSLVNGRLQTCYIIRTEYLQSGFNTLEDFAQYVHIRQQNKITLRYGLLGIDCAEVGRTGGGLQMFDRDAQLDDEIPKLKKIYPAVRFKPVEGKAWSIEPVLTGDFFGVKKL